MSKVVRKSKDPLFKEIVKEAKHQRSPINGKLLKAVASTDHFQLGYCYTPTIIMLALAKAGDMLSRNPDIQLAKKKIEFPAKLADSPLHMSFVRIVNASVTPELGIAGRTFTCNNVKSARACGDAEYNFGLAFKDLEDEEKIMPWSKDRLGLPQIFVDDANEPVLLRKFSGEHTALSLKEVTINGIPYPTGSIMKICTTDQYDASTNQTSRATPPKDLELLSTDTISKLAFKRMAGFVLDADSRSRLFERTFLPGSSTLPPMSEIVEIAQHATSRVPTLS